MDLEYKMKSVDAEYYAKGHPAIQLSKDIPGGECIDVMRYVSCINGICDYPGPKEKTVYSDDDDYAKWRNSEYFDKDDIIPEIDDNPPVEVPYEVYYGYAWKPAKVAYCGDISWILFSGDKYELINADYRDYCRFAGADLGPFDTYEETWIAIADWIRENLGDWTWESLCTEVERVNHKEVDAFNFIDCEVKGFREMKFNDGWIRITDEIINNRWFTKFVETDYFKEKWKSTFDSNHYGLPYKDVYERIMKFSDDFDSMRVVKRTGED